MATKTLTTRIIIRNDTAENWTASNPTLLKGEIGQEIDTGKYKLGNGIDDWNLLPYFVNLGINDKTSLDKLIKMLNEDSFGKVNDVMVNNNSVLGEDKVAKIVIGDLTISEETQQIVSHETFTNNIVLHKVAKTGSYNDLLNKLNIIDSLDSTSTTEPVSANQAHVLKQMIQALPTAKSYTNIQSMITALNSYSNTELNVGVSLYLQQLGVPDFWVYSKEETNVPYTYTDDSAFINAIQTTGAVQVGYYKVSALESAKVNLDDYYTKQEIDDLLENIDLTGYARSEDLENVINNTTQISGPIDAPYGEENDTRYTSLRFGGADTNSKKWSIVIGANTKGGQLSVGLGNSVNASANGDVAVGSEAGRSEVYPSGTTNNGVAIGANAKIQGSGTIQLGTGTNTEAGSFQVKNYKLLDSNGYIPNERLNENVLVSDDTLILDGGSSVINSEA